MLTVPFDATKAATTPNSLVADGSALQALARAALNGEAAGFDVDAPRGSVQFVEKSLPDGTASGTKLPWPGSHNAEGGFNVFSTSLSGDDTLIPQHKYSPVMDAVSGAPLASGLTAEGYQIRYGSSWMMAVSFTDQGPVAKGILTYSESSNALSPSFVDQSVLYSTEKQFRPLLFTEDEIAAAVESTVELSMQKMQ